MTFQKIITKDIEEIRCPNVITNKDSKRYGLQCNTLLVKLNSNNKVAGEFKCRSCNAIIEIKNMILILKNTGGKK